MEVSENGYANSWMENHGKIHLYMDDIYGYPPCFRKPPYPNIARRERSWPCGPAFRIIAPVPVLSQLILSQLLALIAQVLADGPQQGQ